MGRKPCCEKDGKRGSWSPEEDAKLKVFIQANMGNGGNWIKLPSKAGLNRCGKSCRLRWMNYLRPDIIHGNFTEAETKTIRDIHEKVGNRWSFISKHLPGRTDNDIKNYWNTRLKKKVAAKGLNSPLGHQQQSPYMTRIAAVPMFQSGLNLPFGHQQQRVHMRSPAAVPMIQSCRLSQDVVIRPTHMSGYHLSMNYHQTMATQYVEQFQHGNYAIQQNFGNCQCHGNLPPLVETRESQFPSGSRGGQLHESLSGDDFSISYGDPPPSEDASAWMDTLLASDLVNW